MSTHSCRVIVSMLPCGCDDAECGELAFEVVTPLGEAIMGRPKRGNESVTALFPEYWEGEEDVDLTDEQLETLRRV